MAEKRHLCTILSGPQPLRGTRFRIAGDPPKIMIGKHHYELITDPETGESLRAYAWVRSE